MRTFHIADMLEPLMEDIHDIPEYFPPIFNCFAMKVEPLMWLTSILVFDSVSSWSISILARGASRRAIEWSRLLELGQGPKSTGEWSRGHEILISLISWGSEIFFFFTFFFWYAKIFSSIFKIATTIIFFAPKQQKEFLKSPETNLCITFLLTSFQIEDRQNSTFS